jgi:hypothetical protein
MELTKNDKVFAQQVSLDMVDDIKRGKLALEGITETVFMEYAERRYERNRKLATLILNNDEAQKRAKIVLGAKVYAAIHKQNSAKWAMRKLDDLDN